MVKPTLEQEVEYLKRRLAESEREADAAWVLIYSAGRIIEDKSKGTPHQRYSKALYELGLIGEKHGEGRGSIRYQTIADRYHHLRTGGYEGQRNGPPKKIEPHTHDEAVSTIFTEFDIDWAALQRAWRRHGIKVSIKSEVFPKS